MDRINSFKVTVTTSGTPVRLSATHFPVGTAIIQSLRTNVARIIMAGAEVLWSTNTGVIIGPPSSSTATPPSATLRATPGRTIDLTDIWIDAETSGEGVSVTIGER